MGEKSAGSGEAGHAGKDVRSDLHVAIEARDSGGLEITMQSRVGLYYGDSILAQARQVLEVLGVKHARVSIHDEGALPFVISAQIETARRTGLRAGTSKVLPEKIALPQPSPRDRLRRSRLYLPGSEPKYFINAVLHGPDAIILDLEDSVHHAEKMRRAFLSATRCAPWISASASAWCASTSCPWASKIWRRLFPNRRTWCCFPKAELPEQIAETDRMIGELKGRYGITRPIWLMPILESALGIENASAIAQASKNVVALTIGLEDYTADLGVAKTAEGRESLYARSRLVNAARAMGVQAIDSVFGDVGDMDGLRRWAENSRALGFEGMGCIHPGQIPVIHEAFAPSAAEIEKALKIVAAFEEAQQRGLGVVSLGSKMIDPPVVHRAQKLVNWRRRGRLDGDKEP